MSLRRRIIRLAYQRKDLRQDLLSVLAKEDKPEKERGGEQIALSKEDEDILDEIWDTKGNKS